MTASALGTYQQNGSDTISKTFKSDFENDRDYNLTITACMHGNIVSDTFCSMYVW